MPKQFAPLIGDNSLFIAAAQRSMLLTENEPIVVKQEQKLLAYDILHPPKAEHTLPTVYIRYKGQGASQPETRYS